MSTFMKLATKHRLGQSREILAFNRKRLYYLHSIYPMLKLHVQFRGHLQRRYGPQKGRGPQVENACFQVSTTNMFSGM